MASFPNQKKVVIDKNESAPFLQVNYEDLIAASQVLNFSEFKLFLYLASNRKGFALELSPQDFTERFGVSRASYNRAIARLIELGYLRHDHADSYHFNTNRRES